MKRANAGKLDGVNAKLRPVSAESLENLVTTLTAPGALFLARDACRPVAVSALPWRGFLDRHSDEGSELASIDRRQRRCMTIPRRNSGAPSSVWRKRSCRRAI